MLLGKWRWVVGSRVIHIYFAKCHSSGFLTLGMVSLCQMFWYLSCTMILTTIPRSGSNLVSIHFMLTSKLKLSTNYGLLNFLLRNFRWIHICKEAVYILFSITDRTVIVNIHVFLHIEIILKQFFPFFNFNVL